MVPYENWFSASPNNEGMERNYLKLYNYVKTSFLYLRKSVLFIQEV